jgi:inner membrane protein
MNRLNLFFKAAAVGFLTLLLLIPLSMINGTIADRQTYRQQAVQSVAKSYAGPQSLLAPVVVVPYRVEVIVNHTDERGVVRTTTEIQNRQWSFFPKDVQLRGNLVPAVKKRGLHEVRVYEMTAVMAGRFDFTVPTSENTGNLVDVGQPYMSFGISDVRGLVGTPRLTLDRQPIALLQGSSQPRGNGLHAYMAPAPAGQRRQHLFRMEFTLGGTEQFAFVPLGDNNHVELKSTWPHPNFDGQFSPRNPQISAKGFLATWDISALGSGAQAQYLGGATPAATAVAANAMVDPATGNSSNTLDSLSVTMIEPVNVYSQADRASKYGILFVVLTFVGFFMYELVKRLAIHPIQYLLVGLALAIFFLLLLSLSEHIPFYAAYLLASVACIGLLGVYLSAVLKSRSRGVGFAAMLTLLYAALYGLLVSEDNALVLGSLLLFAILAAVMLITRKIDWYTLGQAVPPPIPAE